MSLEAIKVVTDAEERARIIKKDSEESSALAISEAEAAGDAAIRDAEKKAIEELRELRKKADEKATRDAATLAANTENKKAAMRARAESRLDSAAMLVVERIVNS